jgi:hypothetical protein
MSSNPWYVLGGFVFFSLVGFSVVLGYTLLFLKLSQKKKIELKKLWLPVAILTVTWILSTMVAVMLFAGYGVLSFAIALTLLLLGFGYLISRKTLNLNMKQGIFYSIGFSAIISPIWYFLF